MEQEYILYLENDNKSNGTIKTYLEKLHCYEKWLEDSTGKKVKKLYRENIKDYVGYLKLNKKTDKGTSLTAKTINNHISALIKYNEFLVKAGKQSDIVISKADMVKVQRTYVNPAKVTQKEIETFRQDILEADCRSKNNFETKRNFCMVTILQYCGIRISEELNIELDDFSLETMELVIRYGKGEKQRIVYLNEKCASAIKEYLKVRPKNAGKYLFVSRESKGKDKPMDRSTINRIFNKHSNKMTPHQERHRMGYASD